MHCQRLPCSVPGKPRYPSDDATLTSTAAMQCHVLSTAWLQAPKCVMGFKNPQRAMQTCQCRCHVHSKMNSLIAHEETWRKKRGQAASWNDLHRMSQVNSNGRRVDSAQMKGCSESRAAVGYRLIAATRGSASTLATSANW